MVESHCGISPGTRSCQSVRVRDNLGRPEELSPDRRPESTAEALVREIRRRMDECV